MNRSNLAFMVRDNAVHGWRTIEEIANDEAMDCLEVWAACEAILCGADMDDVRSYSRGR